MAEQTLTNSRNALGPDHPITLVSAAALTAAMNGLGDTHQARDLGEDTYTRARRALGEHHPITASMSLQLNNAEAVGKPPRN